MAEWRPLSFHDGPMIAAWTEGGDPPDAGATILPVGGAPGIRLPTSPRFDLFGPTSDFRFPASHYSYPRVLGRVYNSHPSLSSLY
jgi:hypothetical protein